MSNFIPVSKGYIKFENHEDLFKQLLKTLTYLNTDDLKSLVSMALDDYKGDLRALGFEQECDIHDVVNETQQYHETLIKMYLRIMLRVGRN